MWKLEEREIKKVESSSQVILYLGKLFSLLSTSEKRVQEPSHCGCGFLFSSERIFMQNCKYKVRFTLSDALEAFLSKPVGSSFTGRSYS